MTKRLGPEENGTRRVGDYVGPFYSEGQERVLCRRGSEGDRGPGLLSVIGCPSCW